MEGISYEQDEYMNAFEFGIASMILEREQTPVQFLKEMFGEKEFLMNINLKIDFLHCIDTIQNKFTNDPRDMISSG